MNDDTGTDRVELTEDEWDQLAEAAENETLGEVAPPRGGELELTVESIVAARVQAQSYRCQNCSHRPDEHTNKWGCGPDGGPACPCTAYREPVPPGDRLTDSHSEKQNALNNRCQRVEKANKTLRAELAAANARLQQTESEWRELAAEREAANARCAELEAEKRHWQKETHSADTSANACDDELEALQATLDRVTASCTCGATDA